MASYVVVVRLGPSTSWVFRFQVYDGPPRPASLGENDGLGGPSYKKRRCSHLETEERTWYGQTISRTRSPSFTQHNGIPWTYTT